MHAWVILGVLLGTCVLGSRHWRDNHNYLLLERTLQTSMALSRCSMLCTLLANPKIPMKTEGYRSCCRALVGLNTSSKRVIPWNHVSFPVANNGQCFCCHWPLKREMCKQGNTQVVETRSIFWRGLAPIQPWGVSKRQFHKAALQVVQRFREALLPSHFAHMATDS